MAKFYTKTQITIPAAPGAVQLAFKTAGSATVMVNVNDDNKFSFPAGDLPGTFVYQQADDAGQVVFTGAFTVDQNLIDAPADWDPRSMNEQTLEALEAKIAGRALTIQQSRISIGDRSIDYMNSIEELTKWRDYFRKEVAKEKGHGTPTAMVCRLRGNA